MLNLSVVEGRPTDAALLALVGSAHQASRGRQLEPVFPHLEGVAVALALIAGVERKRHPAAHGVVDRLQDALLPEHIHGEHDLLPPRGLLLKQRHDEVG